MSAWFWGRAERSSSLGIILSECGMDSISMGKRSDAGSLPALACGEASFLVPGAFATGREREVAEKQKKEARRG